MQDSQHLYQRTAQIMKFLDNPKLHSALFGLMQAVERGYSQREIEICKRDAMRAGATADQIARAKGE